MFQRTCAFHKQSGERCRQAPLQGEEFCFWHHPDHAEDAEQARRLGGQRRRREKTLEGAYSLESLDSVAGLRRLLDIVVLDTVGLENSVARNRALLAAILAGARLLEVGEMDERLAAVEAALGPRIVRPERRR